MKETGTPHCYIGKVAERTGATRRAIRLYETLGLIPPPQRRGRYRVYSETEVKAIALIKRAQECGVSLAEMKALVNVKVRENRFPVAEAQVLIEQKRHTMDAEIARLQKLRQSLDVLELEVATRYGNSD